MPALIAAVMLLPALAFAQVPSKLAYQGRLLGPDGSPVSGQVNMKFSLFDAAGGEVWREAQTLGLTDGFYATYLGDSGGRTPPATFTSTPTRARPMGASI